MDKKIQVEEHPFPPFLPEDARNSHARHIPAKARKMVDELLLPKQDK
jgi:hypothetical protein